MIRGIFRNQMVEVLCEDESGRPSQGGVILYSVPKKKKELSPDD